MRPSHNFWRRVGYAEGALIAHGAHEGLKNLRAAMRELTQLLREDNDFHTLAEDKEAASESGGVALGLRAGVVSDPARELCGERGEAEDGSGDCSA